MEIRKTNMEIRKNWNKFPFKKLGIIFCLFLFSIVIFISGNLSQVNAASSSTVLPIAKGGTGSNSASGAATNILGNNYANYSGVLPVAKGGTGANNTIQAQKNLQVIQSYTYDLRAQNIPHYIRIGMVKIDTGSSGSGVQTVMVSGVYPYGSLGSTFLVEMSGRSGLARLSMLSANTCDTYLLHYDLNGIRYYYVNNPNYMQNTTVNIIQSDPSNPAFEPMVLTAMPSGYTNDGKSVCRS